jgi:hypothetical protein
MVIADGPAYLACFPFEVQLTGDKQNNEIAYCSKDAVPTIAYSDERASHERHSVCSSLPAQLY